MQDHFICLERVEQEKAEEKERFQKEKAEDKELIETLFNNNEMLVKEIAQLKKKLKNSGMNQKANDSKIILSG